MPKMLVGDKGDYYWIDDYKYLYTFQYRETMQQVEALRNTGTTIYDRMALKVKDQIPEDYWELGIDDTDWGKEFVTIRRYWAHKNHHHFVAASRY